MSGSRLCLKNQIVMRQRMLTAGAKDYTTNMRHLKAESVTKNLFKNRIKKAIKEKKKNKVTGAVKELTRSTNNVFLREKYKLRCIQDLLREKRLDWETIKMNLMDQWRALAHKEALFTEIFMHYNRFVRTNMDKRMREQQKVNISKETISNRIKINEELRTNIETITKLNEVLRENIKKRRIYEEYLNAVLEWSDVWKTKNELMDRYYDLVDAGAAIWEIVTKKMNEFCNIRNYSYAMITNGKMELLKQVLNFNVVSNNHYQARNKAFQMERIVEKIVGRCIIVSGNVAASKSSLDHLVRYLKERQKKHLSKTGMNLRSNQQKVNFIDKSLSTVMTLVQAIKKLDRPHQAEEDNRVIHFMKRKENKSKTLLSEPPKHKQLSFGSKLTGIPNFDAKYQTALEDIALDKRINQNKNIKYKVAEAQYKVMQAHFGETNKDLFVKIKALITIAGKRKKIESERNTITVEPSRSSTNLENSSALDSVLGAVVSGSAGGKETLESQGSVTSLKSKPDKKSKQSLVTSLPNLPFQTATRAQPELVLYDRHSLEPSHEVHSRGSMIKKEINVNRQFKIYQDKYKQLFSAGYSVGSEKIILPPIQEKDKPKSKGKSTKSSLNKSR